MESTLQTVFIVRQLYHYASKDTALTEYEGAFSTFNAAHKYMLDHLCEPEASEFDLKNLRNEITRLRLDASDEPGPYWKKVYLVTGALHVDYTVDSDSPYGIVDDIPTKFAVGDLVKILPDYRCPVSNIFHGGTGVIRSVIETRELTPDQCPYCMDYDYEVFWLTETGRLALSTTLEATLEPLSEPLDEEQQFLQRLSDHLKREKPLSKELTDWLNAFQPNPSVYFHKTPVFDFTSGAIRTP